MIYKWTELVNGEAKIRYSNVPPKGLPFEIATASGDKFRVNQEHQLAYNEGNTRVITVVTNDGIAHVIQLLTITNLSYLRPH